MTVHRAPVRLELAQFRPRKGQVEENLSRISEWVRAARGRADLVVFPECALSGYFVQGGVEEVARTPARVAAGLGPADGESPDVVVGFYEAGGGPLHNAVAWFTPEAGAYRLVHRHRKVFRPTYGLFDEARFVAAGTEVRAFETRFGPVGLLLCEELFHCLVPTALALQGARLLVGVAAAPIRDPRSGEDPPGSLGRWEVAARAAAQEHGVHLAIAQLVGTEAGKVFPGGSAVYLPGGDVGARAPLLREDRLRAVLDPGAVRRHRVRAPLLADLEVALPHLLPALRSDPGGGGARVEARGAPSSPGPPEEPGPPGEPPASPAPDDSAALSLDFPLVEEILVRFLRDEVVERRGFRDVVVGVSGGVDSAVSLLLAVRALGPEHVHSFLLPYRTSSPESLTHARRVLEVAGVEGRTIEISPMVDAYAEGEEPGLSDRRRGNLAARVRSLVLWDQSARLGALPLGTGNKSERLLGYFTWHADDAPPINPLGDLFKTQVLGLAAHLGVPPEVREKAPSADLVPGVHDEDELGVSYAAADPILHRLLEGHRPGELVRAGFDEGAVESVSRRLRGTHWKRALPTVALLSSTAIGESYLRPADY